MSITVYDDGISRSIASHIKNPKSNHIKFCGIAFECETIEDCKGNLFVKRKTGRWIDGQCSNCKCDAPAYIIDWRWQKDMDAKFCPICGAYMRTPKCGTKIDLCIMDEVEGRT